MRLSPLPVIVLLGLSACAPPGPPPPPPPTAFDQPAPRVSPAGPMLHDLVTGVTQRLQAVSPLNDRVVWASGTGGTFAMTPDGGHSWRSGVVAGADSLEFRDIQVIDEKNVYLLSSGPGTRSRIYRTYDGGVQWQLQLINREPEAFYDCFAFWNGESGLAFSDNVGGRFPILTTVDGGERWNPVTTAPPATQGEGAFAASGTCVITQGDKAAWIATGAGTEARLLYTPDRGRTWQVRSTPMVQGTSTTGHTSIAFRSASDGMAAGGDIGAPDKETDNVVVTHDGGKSWSLGGRTGLRGAVYGVAYAPGTNGTAVAVGPGGASLTRNDGKTWVVMDTLEYWSVAFSNSKVGWMVGPKGRVTKVELDR